MSTEPSSTPPPPPASHALMRPGAVQVPMPTKALPHIQTRVRGPFFTQTPPTLTLKLLQVGGPFGRSMLTTTHPHIET